MFTLHKQKRSGFTLIEVIAVLVVIGIISAVAISRMQSTDDVNLAAHVEMIKSHLRYAQSRAMNTNTVWGINFSSSSSYSLYRDGSINNTASLPDENSTAVTLPSGMTMSGTPFFVSFDSWGQPFATEDATGSSTAKATTVSYGGKTMTINITQTTGFIE